MLTLSQIHLQRGTKVLFDNTSVVLFNKQKVGVVGKNGCGKSSLFGLITGKLHVDGGDFQLQNQLRISTLSQELPDSQQLALDYVLDGDEEYAYWQTKLNDAQAQGSEQDIMQAHEHLIQMGAYAKPSMAASILNGLGFTTSQQSQPVNSFSGGWQMRLSLARCLMRPADLYLLDEPTNHLDLEAIVWLEKWIQSLPAAVILISHDREFLDNVVDKILHIDQQQFKLYSGNYSHFELARAQQLLLQQTMFERQQKHIQHLMSFVERFKAKASKAKQAQSRMKAIERMEVVAQAHLDSEFDFEFYPVQALGNPLLKCNHLSVGYHSEKVLLKNINFLIQPQDRIGLLGPNGMGKSTFIKTLTGEVSPLSGEIIVNSNLKVGYYAQHQLDQLDLSLSPLQTIQALNRKATEQEIRNFLGSFNFRGDMALANIKYFSGGERARLALSKLVWQKPDILLLDEPTNHLDLEIRTSIEIALQSYEGAVILISHDRHLLKTTVNDFYLIYNGELTPFTGDLQDYYQWLISKDLQNAIKSPENVTKANDYKETRVLQNKAKKLEGEISKLELALQEIQVKLYAPDLYEAAQQSLLQQLHQQQHTYKTQLDEFEKQWLDIMEKLEG